MDENRMKEIIDQQLDIYINNIARELEKSHDRWFDSYGFPIFGETSKEYRLSWLQWGKIRNSEF